MNPICFYHSADLDGVCSGAIVKHFVPDVELVGFDYGQEFPWEQVNVAFSSPEVDVRDWGNQVEKRTVYMVDVSLPPADMKRLAEVSNLIWIDHHKSAIESCKPVLPATLPGLRLTGKAACELVWAYFEPNKCEPERPVAYDFYLPQRMCACNIPEAVRLLGRYDVADRGNPDWESEILPFQYAIRSEEGIYNPESERWPFLFGVNGYCDSMEAYCEAPWKDHAFNRGSAILRYQAEVNRRACETGAHEMGIYPRGFKRMVVEAIDGFNWIDGLAEINAEDCVYPRDGLRALACNTIVFNSQFFDGFYDPEKHDVMCAYCRLADGRWKVSLYSTKPGIDCGAICKAFGGGGHPGAAGFICNKLPWEFV